MRANGTIHYVIYILVLLSLLAFTREWMQAHMARHMLLQIPLLALTGWSLHRVCGLNLQIKLAPWNQHGLTGLILVQCLAIFWMVPRALDLALSSVSMELIKYAGWLFAGMLLRQSMLQSTFILQLFMLGNVTMMTAVVSDIYATAPNRLCNFYGIDEQAVTAKGLWWMLIGVGIAWALAAWRNGIFPGNSTALPITQTESKGWP
jgi:hypothetical protein